MQNLNEQNKIDTGHSHFVSSFAVSFYKMRIFLSFVKYNTYLMVCIVLSTKADFFFFFTNAHFIGCSQYFLISVGSVLISPLLFLILLFKLTLYLFIILHHSGSGAGLYLVISKDQFLFFLISCLFF